MADPLTMVIGIGIAMGVMLVVSYTLGTEHEVLKFLLMMSVLALLLIMPKVFGDTKECDNVISNTTVSGNVTSYGYTSYCYENTTTTTKTFMRIVYWTYYLIIGYIIVFLFMRAIGGLWNMRGGPRG